MEEKELKQTGKSTKQESFTITNVKLIHKHLNTCKGLMGLELCLAKEEKNVALYYISESLLERRNHLKQHIHTDL